jgi:RNA polymerase sigma factor (sigma-70 family)
MEISLEQHVEAARAGDLEALETLIHAVQQRIYGIALRMLGHPQDAQDAMQEILLKIVTNLSSFRGESTFTTWSYRIAVNHLLTTRKQRSGHHSQSFEELAQRIEAGLAITAGEVRETGADQPLLVREMELECTQGMLLCLDREQRVAYILGEIFEVSSQEGAAILDITPDAFRQRLARARKALRGYMQGICGLVNPANPCRCSRQVYAAIKVGEMKPGQPLPFAGHPTLPPISISPATASRELATLDRVAALFRSHPNYAAPETFITEVKRLLTSEQFHLLTLDHGLN